MWLVAKGSTGRGVGRIRLPAPVRDALIHWYTGVGSAADEAAGIMLVQQARIGSRWLACDCLGTDVAPPILTPAYLSHAETYYLRRVRGANRPEHQTECPFFRDQATSRRSDSSMAPAAAASPDGFFSVLRPAPEQLAQRPDPQAIDDRTRHASIPSLGQLLRRLLALSGRNRLNLNSRGSPGISAEFAAVVATAGRLNVAPGVELSRVLWTHGAALHSRRAYASLRRLAERWPRGHAPQGFLLVYASEIHGHLIHIAGSEPIRVANRVQSPSTRDRPVGGPYLVLVVIGEFPEARGYAPLRAYAQPIYSGRAFVPVDDEYERQVWNALIAIKNDLDHQGIDLAAEKPLFDILMPAGECRPHFVVETRSRKTGEIARLIVQLCAPDDAAPASSGGSDAALRQLGRVLTLAEKQLRLEDIQGLIARAVCLGQASAGYTSV